MQKLAKCKACAVEFSRVVSTCPSCGVRRSNRVGLFVALGVFLVIVAVAAGTSGTKKEKPAPSPSASVVPAAPAKADPPAPKEEPPVDVTVPILFADYRANEIGADTKYKGKVLRVKAIVAAVAKDDLGHPFVGLVAPGRKLMKAIFSSERGLGELKPNDTIVIRCRGNGLNLGGPELADCVLE